MKKNASENDLGGSFSYNESIIVTIMSELDIRDVLSYHK